MFTDPLVLSQILGRLLNKVAHLGELDEVLSWVVLQVRVRKDERLARLLML